jgi:hypothetical protein
MNALDISATYPDSCYDFPVDNGFIRLKTSFART